MNTRKSLVIVIVAAVTLTIIGVIVWNTSSSFTDSDPPPIVNVYPPKGNETKSKSLPQETVLVKDVSKEVKKDIANYTNPS
jgi:hypothetical protein